MPAIKALKTFVRANPAVYRMADALVKLDLEHLTLPFTRGRYLTPHGGTWLDRRDFDAALEERLRSGSLPPHLETPVRNLRREGFHILAGAIDPALIDAYLGDLEREKSDASGKLLMAGSYFKGVQPFRAERLRPEESVRIIDDYFLFPSSRALLLHPRIVEILRAVFETTPMLTQSLSFTYGSQQEIHQDTVFVGMSSPNKMVAAWIALEDVTAGSGELVYYPRSHLWEDFKFSGKFVLYDRERDGEGQIQAFFRSLEEKAKRDGIAQQTFLPRKGDVFLWHAKLAHGGKRILTPGKTRKSLVGHFCPVGVRPSYHYFNFSKRRIYGDGPARYTTQAYPYPAGG